MYFLIAIALLVVSYTITALTTPKADKPKPALLSEFDFPQVDEGTPQSVIFGDCWTEDWVVLWYGNYRTTAIKSNGSKK